MELSRVEGGLPLLSAALVTRPYYNAEMLIKRSWVRSSISSATYLCGTGRYLWGGVGFATS